MYALPSPKGPLLAADSPRVNKAANDELWKAEHIVAHTVKRIIFQNRNQTNGTNYLVCLSLAGDWCWGEQCWVGFGRKISYLQKFRAMWMRMGLVCGHKQIRIMNTSNSTHFSYCPHVMPDKLSPPFTLVQHCAQQCASEISSPSLHLEWVWHRSFLWHTNSLVR